ncbi:MAG: exonuclease domain-containing protein [Gammaproteobacteria bacterium]|nr:exonuclease domain-containing protein [Gammaproteobacteria bacterium]
MPDGPEDAGTAAQPGLPTFYYHAHFIEMLDFVSRHYAHVLLDEHRSFVDDFRSLPLDAQRLYVRLVNRKGRVFARSRLRYPELGRLDGPIGSLTDGGWVGRPSAEHFDELLTFLTRAELLHALIVSFAGLGRSLKKGELVEFARAHADPAEFVTRFDTGTLLVQRRARSVQYLLYLYFGRIEDGLSRFTMRDLGLVRTQGFTDSYEPRFNDRDEALEHFYFATRLARLERKLPGEEQRLIDESEAWPDPASAGAAALRDRLAFLLGREAEKEDEPDRALTVYRRGESIRCNERVLHLLLGSGQADVAREFLERCLDDPRNDEEWLFAADMYQRKFEKKRTSALTDILRASETIELDESLNGAPERGVVEWYERRGMRAFRVENSLWRTLFGLLFWDLLFGPDRASLSSPFDLVPVPLRDGSFYGEHEFAIEERLALLDDPAATSFELLRTSTRHFGTPNGVFRWRQATLDALLALLETARGDALRIIVRRFCQAYADSRHGYPDLLLIDADGARFIEVKAEGDQLRRNQLLRIEQLRAAGFRADVLRVRWTLDPDQAYSVVDIETTGGNGPAHRVAEIGAVKIRNGRIVDRYSTLVHPQRPIPASITRLTGISNAMVADAPRFADIADDLEAFLQGSIFVAHNVAFDYRFIAAEYERLGRPFRYPRLCTCASMRKLFPGLPSYSLAELCGRFDIPLKSHHRALCDAEAAAQLLLIVNEKRLEQLGRAA